MADRVVGASPDAIAALAVVVSDSHGAPQGTGSSSRAGERRAHPPDALPQPRASLRSAREAFRNAREAVRNAREPSAIRRTSRNAAELRARAAGARSEAAEANPPDAKASGALRRGSRRSRRASGRLRKPRGALLEVRDGSPRLPRRRRCRRCRGPGHPPRPPLRGAVSTGGGCGRTSAEAVAQGHGLAASAQRQDVRSPGAQPLERPLLHGHRPATAETRPAQHGAHPVAPPAVALPRFHRRGGSGRDLHRPRPRRRRHGLERGRVPDSPLADSRSAERLTRPRRPRAAPPWRRASQPRRSAPSRTAISTSSTNPGAPGASSPPTARSWTDPPRHHLAAAAARVGFVHVASRCGLRGDPSLVL